MEPVALGDYRVIARLGRGGMADVFLAVRNDIAGFTRLVVIKRLRDDLAELPEGRRYRALLLDEARIAARLRHPNIVQALEVRDDTHTPYLALEYLDGQPLASVMTKARRARTPMPTPIALAIVSDLLSALSYAHGATDYDGTPLLVVHRDVSPQNIFLTYDGEVKLVDFGVAKFARAEETEAGLIKGKLGYMAPEQARGAAIDGRADVFAVGVVLWELMVGRRLVRKGSQAETLQRLLFEPMPSLDGIVPDIDPRIAAICARALEREVSARYPDAAAMRSDIESVLEGARPHREEIAGFIAPMFGLERQHVAERIRAAITGDSLIMLEQAPLETTGSLNEPATTVLLSTRRSHGTSGVVDAVRAAPRRSRAIPFLLAALAATLVAIGIVGYQRTHASCGKKCPDRYAKAVTNARRLSLDFRFRSGRDAMDSRGTRDLDRLIHFLATRPDTEILLLGFSDSAGDPSYNTQLSRQRAQAIASELALRGVRPAAVEGFGAALPIASNSSEADRERNRRVEVWLRPRR